MNDRPPTEFSRKPGAPARGQVPPGLTIGDVWYVLFRHKWLILSFALAGILGSAVVYATKKKAFISEAKLFVRYVVETKSMEAIAEGGQVRAPSLSAESIINSELEILTSRDLCEQVAAAVGPGRILGGTDGGSNVTLAAAALYEGLSVEAPRRSSVIRISLAHSDPALVQGLLTQLLEAYFKRHKDIHRAVGSMDTILSQQADQLRSRLMATEKELQALKSKAGVISVEDARRTYTEQYASVRQLLLAAESELAEYQVLSGGTVSTPSTNGIAPALSTNTTVSAVSTNGIAPAASTNATISLATSNAPASGPSTNPAIAAAPTGPSRETLEEYRTVSLRIAGLRSSELDLRATYTEGSRAIGRLREQIAEMEKIKSRLEEESPELRGVAVSANPASSTASLSGYDLNRSRALEAKAKVLRTELEKLRTEMAVFEEAESSISQVQRRKELEEKNYGYFAAGLEAARFNEAFGASSQLANIGMVQAPSAPAPAAASRLKSVAMVLFGCLFAGLGLAFVIELAVDHTVRRPFQVDTRLLLPLFFSIPRLRLNGSRKRFVPDNAAPASPEGDPEVALPAPLAEWNHDHPFRPHLESLRDRVLMHFEGDGHKPKLIGLTSCREGAGVTTLALGLAAALSETGDGRVLFVNLDYRAQSLHPFFQGKPVCGLTDVLENNETASIGQNLYLATAGASGNGLESLPRSVSRIMPKLKLSDYDFIVFDLPRITRTSMTPKLAGMLDLVLMVVESEKEPQDMVKRAAALMQESQASVSVVLNKLRSFVPARLHKEL